MEIKPYRDSLKVIFAPDVLAILTTDMETVGFIRR